MVVRTLPPINDAICWPWVVTQEPGGCDKFYGTDVIISIMGNNDVVISNKQTNKKKKKKGTIWSVFQFDDTENKFYYKNGNLIILKDKLIKKQTQIASNF